MNKKVVGLGLVAVAALGLAACGNRASRSESSSDASVKPAIVTDIGGVDDRSFNQSAWEGLQKWGDEKGLSKDKGYTYFQSASEADYINNLDQAVSSGYNLVFGIGYALRDSIESVADNNKDVHYVIVDDVVEGKDNVASVTFADQEAAYLAGVAAAKSTKTNKVGFIGGVESDVITRFEKGFEAGVKSVNPSIQIQVDYAGSFGDAAKGQAIAEAQYKGGADIIFHASGGTGNGVFAAAKAENETRAEADKVWVIGVDRDQSEEGKYTSKDGKESNFVLASTIKEVGKVVQLITTDAEDDKFAGGTKTVYGIKDEGVDIAMTNLSDDAKKAVEESRQAILDGKLEVPTK